MRHKMFDNFIFFLIAVSTINIAIQNELDDPNGEKARKLGIVDLFLTGCFTMEMAIKIIALGFWSNGDKSYLRDSWNIMDFVIVVSGLLDLVVSAGPLKILKSLRVARVFRPLRMVSKYKSLKIALVSLLKSLPKIVNLLILVSFFNFLFGILHTKLFGGLFFTCHFVHLKDNGSLSFEQTSRLINTKWDCVNYGGEWVNADFNFDNVLQSMLVLTSIQSKEGWFDPVMWSEIDNTEVDSMPRQWNKSYYAFFAILINLVSNLIFLQLFSGVVIQTFKKQKDHVSGKKMLSKT